jgi:hypothetical protein
LEPDTAETTSFSFLREPCSGLAPALTGPAPSFIFLRDRRRDFRGRASPENPGRIVVKIEYFHASKFGNGAAVAEEFKRLMAAKGVAVDVHHMRDARPKEMPPADLYVFSSPGRMGKPIGRARRFLKKAALPPGTKVAILTTEGAPRPDKKTGRMPTEEEQAKWQRVTPILNEILRAKGFVKVAEGKVLVTGLKGPLEEGWQEKVGAFASRIPNLP